MEKAAIQFAAENGQRLSIILPTGMYGPVILPGHMKGNPHSWLKKLIDGEEPPHQKIPNDSTSMSHLHDLASLFLAVYENQKHQEGTTGFMRVGTGRISMQNSKKYSPE